MKRLFIILFCSFLVLITSCSKNNKFNNVDYGKIDYYYSGLYLEIKKDESFSVDSLNPCIYFAYNNETLTTNSGIYGIFQNTSKVVNNDGCHININASFHLLDQNIEELKLYPICYKDGEYEVLEDVFTTINLKSNSKYNYIVEFTNKLDYKVQISLLFN